MTRGRWNQRAFVAIAAIACGLAVPITGVADHMSRHRSSDVQAGWAVVHTALGVMLTAFCTWHIVLNRGALLRYLREPLRRLPRPELLAALALVGGVLAVGVTHALLEG